MEPLLGHETKFCSRVDSLRPRRMGYGSVVSVGIYKTKVWLEALTAQEVASTSTPTLVVLVVNQRRDGYPINTGTPLARAQRNGRSADRKGAD
jgi:hypothetical protein